MDRWAGNLARFVWAAPLGVAALGCSSVALEEAGSGVGQSEGAEAAVVAPRLSPNWVGYRAGVSPGKWRDLGKLPHAGAELAMPLVPKDLKPADSARDASMNAVILDYAGERVYHWQVPRDSLEAIAKFRESQASLVAPSGNIVNGEAPEREAEVESRNWSNGVDGRIPRGIYEAGEAGNPHRKIGQVVGGNQDNFCTGTLIGGATWDGMYYVATAAHCLFAKFSGTAWTPMTFEPRRDLCQDNTNTNIPGCDGTPYGTWNKGGSALVSEYFYANCRGLPNFGADCVAEDTAIFIVKIPGHWSGNAWVPDVPDPGFMAFRRATTASLSSWFLRAWGYPNCWGTDDPLPGNSCRTATLYGDTADCAVSGFAQPDENGQMRYGQHSCDTSEGMSGTALFANLQTYGYTVLGINSAGSGIGATPNAFRVNTTAWVDLFWAYADI